MTSTDIFSDSITLTILGTGHAMATKCYNSCFVLEKNKEYFLVDGGGGNGIFLQLEKSGIDSKTIKTIFVTHKHMDHLMGVVWLIRKICQQMKTDCYEGEVLVYAHYEVIDIIKYMTQTLLPPKNASYIGKRVHLITIEDGQEVTILGHKVRFFDIHSTKALQFGFSFDLGNGKKLSCCGDEPYNVQNELYVKSSDWLIHEAFCLYEQADIFHPYEKHHSTVKDACELAEQLQIRNLILYHTEDQTLSNRKELYTKEGKQYFSGNLFIPDDLETFMI